MKYIYLTSKLTFFLFFLFSLTSDTFLSFIPKIFGFKIREKGPAEDELVR